MKLITISDGIRIFYEQITYFSNIGKNGKYETLKQDFWEN